MVLWLTLVVIAWQSVETRAAAKAGQVAAEAASKGIEIQAAGQRAWLLIHSAMKDYELTSGDGQLRFWWTIDNRGHTCAQILETQCRYELVEYDPLLNLPPLPQYPDPIRPEGSLIASGDSREWFTGLLGVNGGIVIPPLRIEDLNRIKEGTLHLRVYGYVKYIDGLQGNRESRFIEYYAIAGKVGERGSGFRPLLGAPFDYTRCT